MEGGYVLWVPGTNVHVCGVLTCVEQVEAPPFPNSQALSNVKRVATTPWEGPAFSNFYRA